MNSKCCMNNSNPSLTTANVLKSINDFLLVSIYRIQLRLHSKIYCNNGFMVIDDW